jgi:hypothetical protein
MIDDRDSSLLTSPLDAERNDTREVVRYRGDALARKARKFLTLATHYNECARGSPLRKPTPNYFDWLKTFMSVADARKEAARVHAEWAQRNARPALEPADE